MHDDGTERNWVLQRDREHDDAPAHIVGGWEVRDDGTTGPFRPNPFYAPRDGGPASLIEATIGSVASGEKPAEAVVTAIRDSVVYLALDGDGDVIVAAAPDGVPSVVVVTSAVAGERLSEIPAWSETDLPGLLSLLPQDTDIWVDPGGPASMRVNASALREQPA